LYHDYLSRGVLAAEKRANSWTTLLKDGQDAFENAGGSWVGRWRSLLSPLQQLQLAWNRLRGRFRFGEYRRFALWSLLRFAPFAIGCFLVTAVYLRVTQDQKQHEAKVNGVALAEQIGHSDESQLEEGEAIWTLAQANSLTRRYFWEHTLNNPDCVAGTLKHVDLTFHATVGLDVDGRARQFLVDSILSPALRKSSKDTHALCLIAKLYTAADATRDDFASQLRKDLFAQLRDARGLDAKASLAEALAALPGNPESALSAAAFKDLLSHFREDTDAPGRLEWALVALADQLEPGQATAAFKELSAALRAAEHPSFKGSLARILAAVAGKLEPGQAADAFNDLLAALRDAKDPDVKARLAQALAAVPGKLDRGPLQALFDVLKWPTCVGESRKAILQRLEKESAEQFTGSLFKAATWGQQQKLDVTSPPRRPGT
jgi:hypothetical protein